MKHENRPRYNPTAKPSLSRSPFVILYSSDKCADFRCYLFSCWKVFEVEILLTEVESSRWFVGGRGRTGEVEALGLRRRGGRGRSERSRRVGRAKQVLHRTTFAESALLACTLCTKWRLRTGATKGVLCRGLSEDVLLGVVALGESWSAARFSEDIRSLR